MVEKPAKLFGIIASGGPPEAVLAAMAVHTTAASETLPAWIVSALGSYPSDFMLSFAHPEVDVAACSKPSHIVVCRDNLIAVTTPDTQGKPLHFVRYGAGTRHIAHSADDVLRRIVQTAYLFPECLNTLVAVASADCAWSSYAMVLRGMGMAWLPESLVKEDLATSRLLRADYPELDIPVDIRVYRSARPSDPVVEDAWNFFRHRYAGMAPLATCLQEKY